MKVQHQDLYKLLNFSMMVTLKKLFASKKSRLSLRLLSCVIICSSFFALFVSVFQLYLDYEKDLDSINSSFQYIKESRLETLASDAYNMDMEQLGKQLDGILKLQDIEYIEITEIFDQSKVVLAQKGNKEVANDIYQEFRLVYPFIEGKFQQYAVLRVVASLEGVYQRLRSKAITIITFNVIKTLLASFFIFFIFQYLITRHLVAMADYAQKIKLNKLEGKLVLDRKASKDSEQDELDLLVASINKMQLRLMRELEKQTQMKEIFSYQATHDDLTELVNRREFERRIENLLTSMRPGIEHALCFMDLDQFKIVNDTCGHTAGDELLHQLSNELSTKVRSKDVLARIGGDEFGLLMEDCSLDNARRVLNEIFDVVQEFQFYWENHSFRVGISIGLVSINESTVNLTDILKAADVACYMAKEEGRNRIHVFNRENKKVSQRHGEMQWVEKINKALEENRFCLYSQLIKPLHGFTNNHYELLIRLRNENNEIIPPGVFLPAAERYDLMGKIDRWVIKNAFHLIANNPTLLNEGDFCSINLSGQSVGDPEILKYIIGHMDSMGIKGKSICFEITETTAISNLISAKKLISELKALGCKFALDDFGSGLSSFGYLKNLEVDYLKIDGMFVKEIVNDPIDHAMVESINQIGQVMGMETIAEFVENDEIKDILSDIGVNYAQGYGIDKPKLFDRVIKEVNNLKKINFTTDKEELVCEV